MQPLTLSFSLADLRPDLSMSVLRHSISALSLSLSLHLVPRVFLPDWLTGSQRRAMNSLSPSTSPTPTYRHIHKGQGPTFRDSKTGLRRNLKVNRAQGCWEHWFLHCVLLLSPLPTNSRLPGPQWGVTGRGRLRGGPVQRQLKAIVNKKLGRLRLEQPWEDCGSIIYLQKEQGERERREEP